MLLPLFPFVIITIPSFPHSQDTTEFATRGTTASVTSGAEHYYPPGAPEFIPVFCWVRVAQIFSFLCSVFHFVVCLFLSLFCWPLYCLSFDLLTAFEFGVICVCLRMVVSCTYCVVFSLCFCSSCVPYDTSFSGLSFLDCPCGIM